MKTVQEFASTLFEIEVIAHIAHLQTTSLAQHLSLNELYQGMPELRDSFLESWQGTKGIVAGYQNIQIKEGLDMVAYLDEKIKQISIFRNTVLDDGYLEQLVDNILELLSTVRYKLKSLK